MSKEFSYNQLMDVKFPYHQKFDLAELEQACEDKWFNQTLTQVNDSVVRLGIVEGEYHWHTHESDDEFFYVVSGKLFIDLKDQTIELEPGQGVTIKKGVPHRPRSPEKTVMLMLETVEIDPIGEVQ